MIREQAESDAGSEEGERSFTLIQLLAVAIIIGILAAISIPMFIGQRNQAREAAAQSDLRNAVTTDTARSADNSEKFDGCDIARLTADYGFRKSDKVEFSNVSKIAYATSWSADASHQGGGAKYTFSTVTAQVEKK